MLVTDDGIVMVVKLVPLNAYSPMLVTDDGIDIDVISVYENAFAPMLVTDVGIVIVVIPDDENAFSPMLVYPFIITFVCEVNWEETILAVNSPEPLNVIVVPFTVVDIIVIYITLLIKLK